MAVTPVLFVGSNPSQASKDLTPFDTDTCSGKNLHKWINKASIETAVCCNIVEKPTPNNRPLTKSEIQDNIPSLREKCSKFTKVVAVGRTASMALNIAGIDHHQIEHPSGLNRKLNDQEYVEQMIEDLKKYCDC